MQLARAGEHQIVGRPDFVPEASRRLEDAYAACDLITAEHSRSFHFASRFLPADKRRAIRALYAFCRVTDDIVDEPKTDARAAIEAWRSRTLGEAAFEDDPVAVAWRDARERFQIPTVYAEQLVDGVALDLQPARYQSFGSLAQYCYGVASTVGLMSMHIIGFSEPRAIRYAVKMGVALQLTNILRDVGEDYARGRVYLPQDELAQHGISDADLAAGRIGDRWRHFMRFQIERARSLYREAWPGIALLNRDGRFAVLSAAELYGGILSQIEANDFDVFTRRAHLSTRQKLTRLPSIWLRSRYGVRLAMLREGPA